MRIRSAKIAVTLLIISALVDADALVRSVIADDEAPTSEEAVVASKIKLLGTQDNCWVSNPRARDYYFRPSDVDLIHVLAPPPEIDSPQGKADLQAVRDAQRVRTPAQVESARADACFSILRFANVMGAGFKASRLPFTMSFFQRVFSDDQHAIWAAKKYFNRPHPCVIDHDLTPVVEQSSNPSYPSGHASFAYVTAILLADMVPEKAPQIFERAAAYADGRLIGGAHYPTDLQAGRISASVIDNVLLHNPQARADLARSRAEVRSAIGIAGEGGGSSSGIAG
jgi:acid phosphatase (class A)